MATDSTALPQVLSPGRLFIGDKLDLGLGWSHQLSGKYLLTDLLRVEFRCRY